MPSSRAMKARTWASPRLSQSQDVAAGSLSLPWRTRLRDPDLTSVCPGRPIHISRGIPDRFPQMAQVY
jgi:hypothetical protein